MRQRREAAGVGSKRGQQAWATRVREQERQQQMQQQRQPEQFMSSAT